MAFVAVRGRRDVHNVPYSVGRSATLRLEPFVLHYTSVWSSYWWAKSGGGVFLLGEVCSAT